MDEAPVLECGRELERLTAQALAGGCRDEEGFLALGAALERRIALALESSAGRDEPRPACAPGCAACCTVNVATLPVEGLAVAGFLRRRLAPGEVARRAAALLAFHERVRWCEDAERIRGGLACPFLDAHGACAVHPVRPLACRGVSSLDAAECRRALAERAGDEEDEGAGAVRMNLLQKALHDEAHRAVAAALSARGLDARSRDVSGMAGAFLADPGLVEAWAAGGRVPLE
ncbi:YkgJ family cysteine cluster protein [Anaeromyxobacter diazotrophicus]|uniref:Zinc/iron-chelating domain-containing protein n=1 Tax=Anaeromyxobacter diazotrophicus TaxID=2590199 RepID=A0A7I9VJF5_9BACT|nr:YkgJ family cysteine cluster protein [Anaeromyxobacter diazotrophicus]GEJ56544.1 zinc/iron-chelating domain-containing protein [Anaeromyxobacter diazotrophicus]